jgi:O-antigen/teichoic acid export membrane protein
LRKTIPNILLLIAVNLLVKPFWLFGIDRVVQNQLGESVFGLYFTLFNFSMFFQILNDFGIQNFNSRHIAREPHTLKDYLPSLLTGKFVLSAGYLIVSIAVFLALGYSWQAHGHMLVLLLINQVLISLIFYLRSNLTGLHMFRIDAMFSVLDKLLMILFMGSILYFNFLGIELNITNFILSQTIAFSINAVLLIITVVSLSGIGSFRVNKGLVVRVLKESFPFALSIFLMSIYLRMDTIMIERLLKGEGAYAAGIYAQSFRIIDALNMIGILFANVLLPTYSKALKEGKDLSGLVWRSVSWMAVIVIPVTAVIAATGQPIIDWLYVNNPIASGRVLSILIFSFTAYCFMHIFSSLLTAAGKLKLLNSVFAFGILLNLVANFILIPRFGPVGAAITTACSEWIVLAVIAVAAYQFLTRPTIAEG